MKKNIIKKDYPLSIAVSILLGIFCLDMLLFKAPTMTLGRIDGLILLLVFVIFMYTTIKDGAKHRNENTETEGQQDISLWKSILFCILGLAGIIWGGDMSVEAAKDIARTLGLSEALIGLTIVALGTSLPELVTSVIAAKKGENDLALGNVIGSNIINISLILGLVGIIAQVPVSTDILTDVAILFACTIFFGLVCAKKNNLGRLEGITLLFIYIAYISFAIIRNYCF